MKAHNESQTFWRMRRRAVCGTRRGFGARRGQALVEFALAIPVLIAMLVGIMEFGVLMKNTMTLSSAAREAARAASLGKSTSEINQRVANYASPLSLVAPNGSVVLQQCDSAGKNCSAWPADTNTVPARNGVLPPNMVRVTLNSQHQSLTGLIPRLNRRVITTTVTMRREI